MATNVRENQRGNQEWSSRRNWQPRNDKPEKLATKNGQAGETGNQEWTSRRNWQSRMDQPEKLAIKNGQAGETGNIWVHKTQDEDKQNHEQIHSKLKRLARRTQPKAEDELRRPRRAISSCSI